jgi:hypothetical protein|tara:strand:+ start:1732 stop:2331 length:600 start_codon:yes stop_codon:yes gene_type:complete
MNKQINNISQHSKTVYLESKEIWKPIKGYEGIYEISNKNRVKALEKIVIGGRYNCPRVYKEKILKNTNGDVSLVKNKIKKTYDVYTLKQIHFNGFEPKGKRKEVVKNDKVITRRKFVQDLKSKLENKTSKYVGVSWSKKANKWRSAIKIDKYDIHLGLFEIEEDAKIMYEKAVANIDLYKGIPKHFRSILNIIHLERLP